MEFTMPSNFAALRVGRPADAILGLMMYGEGL